MHGHVLVPLLEPVVLLDVVKVIAPDDHGLVHLHLGDDSGQDAAADRHLADEGALLVDVVALPGLGYERRVKKLSTQQVKPAINSLGRVLISQEKTDRVIWGKRTERPFAVYT